jgi:hypothetical protein
MVQGEFLTKLDVNETMQSTTDFQHNPGQEKGAHHV